MTARSRRGQPLVALGLVVASWIGVRAALWQPLPLDRPGGMTGWSSSIPDLVKNNVPDAPLRGGNDRASARRAERSGAARPFPALAALSRSSLIEDFSPGIARGSMAPRIAAGHHMLWLAATALLPLPPEAMPYHNTARFPARAAQRWSGDAWLLLRPGGNGFNLQGAGLPGSHLPSGSYGASQAGAVIRYRLAPASPLRPAIYLRASSGLKAPRGEETALGLSMRPLQRVPVAAMAEVRVTRTSGGEIVRPAAALVSELAPQDLPLGLRGELYAQAGWVGGRFSTVFADGQARIDHRLLRAGGLELRAGAGAWGGAQRGASRLDLGPSATLAIPLGSASARLSADWRLRAAGSAAPNSGPALTLSAGF